jgi:hypothetical protein
MTHRNCRSLAVALLGLTACFAPAEPVPLRWFAPPAPAEAPAQAAGFRIGGITAAAHLGTAFVWRRSEVEIVLDEVDRWTEEPAVFVARALEAGTPEASAPRLDLRLEAFEAVLGPPDRVEVGGTLILDRLDGSPPRRERILVHGPLDDRRAETVARSIGAALADFAAAATRFAAK